MNALSLADGFWEIYIKNAIAEVEGIEVVLDKASNCKDYYLIFDKEMPYKKAFHLSVHLKIMNLVEELQWRGLIKDTA